MKFLEVTLEIAAIGMAVLSPSGRCLRVNQPLCDLVGYLSEELLGDGLVTLAHPEDGSALATLLGTHHQEPRETRLLHQDGHTIWVKLSLQQIVREAESYLVCQFQDITQEKQTQEALERGDRRLNEIVAAQAMLALAPLDLTGFMNIVVERMLALTPATAAVVELVEADEMVYRAASGVLRTHIGMRLKRQGSLSGLCVSQREVLHAEDCEHDPRVDAAACRRVGAASMIVAPLFQGEQAVGVVKVMADRPYAFLLEDSHTLQLMAGLLGAALAHQLTFEAGQQLLAARTRSEQSLRHSEARIRHILENSLDAFVSMDSEGRISEWNKQAERLFGWSRDEALGRDLASTLIPLMQRQAHNDGILQYQSGGGLTAMLDRRVEVIALTRNGTELSVEMAVSAVTFDQERQYNAFLHDITSRKLAEARLQFMAQHDQLTGLPNRNLFRDRLNQALARSARSHDCLALMYIDVDHFKQVNDTLGHAIGDALLRAFAVRVAAAIRATDTFARLGGDEFTLIAEGLRHAEEAEKMAQKVVDLTAQDFVLEHHPVRVSASIGVAFVQAGGLTAEAMIRKADAALYEAKSAGRNTWRRVQDIQ